MQKLLLISLLACSAVNAAAPTAATKQTNGGQTEGEQKSAAQLLTIDTSKLFSETAAKQWPEYQAVEMLNAFVAKHNEYVVLAKKLFDFDADHELAEQDLNLLKSGIKHSLGVSDDLLKDKFLYAAAKIWRQKHGQSSGPASAEEAHQN